MADLEKCVTDLEEFYWDIPDLVNLRISSLEGRIEPRLATLEKQQAMLTQDMRAIRNELTVVKRELADINAKIGTMESDISGLKAEVSGLKDGLKKRERRRACGPGRRYRDHAASQDHPLS